MALDATEVDKLSNRIQELEKRIEELSSKMSATPLTSDAH